MATEESFEDRLKVLEAKVNGKDFALDLLRGSLNKNIERADAAEMLCEELFLALSRIMPWAARGYDTDERKNTDPMLHPDFAAARDVLIKAKK